MTTFFIIIAIIFGILAVIGFMGYDTKFDKNLPITQRKWVDLEELSFNHEQLQNLFIKLKELYYNGETNSEEVQKLYKEFNTIEVDQYAHDLIDEIFFEILRREPIATKDTDKVLLRPREEQYYYSNMAAIDKIKTLMKTINYMGFRYNKGMFRSGNMWVTADDIQGMRRWDAGDFIVTNQRIVFNGTNQHNFSIPLGNILSYATYENNGVILTIANQNPIIISFPYDNKFQNIVDGDDIMPALRDDKIRLLYALDKVFELRNNK